VHWVKPQLICEVAFTEWTDDGRIRHPSFQGLREDKDASEVIQVKPIPAVSATKGAKGGAMVAAGIAISHLDRVISKTGQVTKENSRNITPPSHLSCCRALRGTRSACCAVRPVSMESSAFFNEAPG
jgi:hypothetical protein